MRKWILALSGMILAAHAMASDYAREERLATEIVPAVLDAEPVRLAQANGHRFLGLYANVPKARGAIVLVHGLGVHPDFGIIGYLRSHLAEQGYATLSVQMPVLAKEAMAGDYVATFPEASERIGAALDWLKAHGHTRLWLVSHSLGGRQTRAYLLGHPAGPAGGWASLSTGFDDFSGLKLPILDLSAERDHLPVLQMQAQRKASLAHPRSVQMQLADTDHFYDGREAAVLERVLAWLKSLD